MKILIFYYSRTGNNRTLAKYLAKHIGADIEEIRPVRTFKLLGFLLDFFKNRKPKIAPITKDSKDYDHVLFIAPLYDMGIAHPMKTALVMLRKNLGRYSFVTLCGYHRDEQSAHIQSELLDLTGHEPEHTQELHVGDLIPEEKRADVMVVSAYKITVEELSAYNKHITTIMRWFGVPSERS